MEESFEKYLCLYLMINMGDPDVKMGRPRQLYCMPCLQLLRNRYYVAQTASVLRATYGSAISSISI